MADDDDQAIVARLEAARADIAALRAGETGALRVGTYQSIGARVLPEVMRRFLTDWPGIDLGLSEPATDPELYAQWVGPRALNTRITRWSARTGGEWAMTDGDNSFFGSFHEVRAPDRLVWTFTWEGAPESVSLETMTLEELPGGRTRLTGVSVVESFELRDQILASGMEVGVAEGYEKLDELLRSQA